MSRQKKVDKKRFFSFIDVTPSCWHWSGPAMKGYGRYSARQAHAVAYEVYVGPIPDGLEVDHLCRNRLCVNPAHLEAVTRQTNVDRRYALLTRCSRGHEFTPKNTFEMPGSGERPRRRCRACWRENSAAYKARRAAA